MQTNQNLNIQTLIFYLSQLFERMAYYGLRAILILYMITELSVERLEALSIYGWITGALIGFGLIGALFGDLLIGNKTSMIIGGVLQIIGALLFLIPNTSGVYAGLFMVILGTGFYMPNVTAQYGKLFLNKPKLLDSAFTGIYVAINIGAFLGILLIGLVYENYGKVYGFALVSILFALSLMFSFLTKDTKLFNIDFKAIKIESRIIKIGLAIIIVALFWLVYQVSSSKLFDIQYALRPLFEDVISNRLWESFTSIAVLPVALIMIFVWYFIYNSQFLKLAIGFIFTTLSFGVLFLIPETIEKNHLSLYLLSILLFAIAEVHVAPILRSVLTQYTNPKYLAIILSLALIPTRLVGSVLTNNSEYFYSNNSIVLILCTVLAGCIGFGLLFFMLLNRKLKLL